MSDNESVVDFARALDNVRDYWSPKILGRVNDQYVKVAKLKGELAWHQHDDEDELFLVVYGHLIIQLPGYEVSLGPGQCFVVPKGMQHNPLAREECGIVLIETVTTLHTGNVFTPLTKSVEEQY